jgi:hypothetical protein
MFFGLLMNLTGQLAKLVQLAVTFGKGLITKGGIVGGIQAVSQSMKYMSIGEIEASIAAKQLGSATTATNQAFRDQVRAAEGAKVAVNDLAATYQFLINRMAEAAGLSKVVLGTPGAAMKIAGKNPKKMARGGVVPGSGNSDTVPAMLMPGEFVVTKRATKSIGKQFLEKINGGEVLGLQNKSALDLFNRQGGVLSSLTKRSVVKKTATPKTTTSQSKKSKADTHLRRTSSDIDNPYGYEKRKGVSGRQKAHVSLGQEHRFEKDTKLITSFGQEVNYPKGFIATSLGNKVINLGSFTRNGKRKSINQALKSKNTKVNPTSRDILDDIELGGDELFTTLNDQVKQFNSLNPANRISSAELDY